MTLQAGQMLAHYRITEKLGSGGMGEVWAAEDTKLKRVVALKALPARVTGDARIRARFEREAQAVAALNHPNIVTIHSVEDADRLPFLTMELVKGELLTRLMNGPLPLDRIFSLFIPLADAVGAAHDQGILHRDLKPDNIMVTPEGRVKVLDFGLAKLREQVADPLGGMGSQDTLTKEGGVIGTAAYMSPEQAEGKPVGPEADVFALGIILYQLSTGERPFSGSTAISLISSILKEEPAPAVARNRALPHHLGRILRRCLAKDPARRYATARSLRNELEDLQQELAAGGVAAEAPAAGPAGHGTTAALAAGLLLMMILAGLGWIRGRGEPPPAAGARVSQQTFYAGVETEPSLSPEGEFLVYSADSAEGDRDIFLQRVDGSNPINLTRDSPASDGQPAFSPDGKQIAFRSERDGGGLYLMGATGEAVRRLTDFGFDPAWSPDGERLAFASEGVDSPLERNDLSTLWIVDVETAETRQIHEGDAVQPAWSPDGRRIAFWTAAIGRESAGQRDLLTVRPDGSEQTMVTRDLAVEWRPRWSADGHQLYFASDRGGSMNLWRIHMEAASGLPRGNPMPLTTPSLWSGPFSISRDGSRLAYVARDERARLVSVPFDPVRGEVSGEPKIITTGSLLVWTWDVSPGGEWIAMTNHGRQEDLYLLRPDGSGLRKLTDDLHKDRGVTWLDDDRLVFYSTRGGGYELWTLHRDGSDPRPITATTGQSLFMPRVSADGTRLMARNWEGTYLFDLSGPMPMRKEEARHITHRGDAGGAFRGDFWSPDGARILGSAGTPVLSRVAVYDLETDALRSFDSPLGGSSEAGGWLPGGRRFVAIAAGAAWVVDLDSGAWRRLSIRGEVERAQLTDDGGTLHYSEIDSEADIWVAWLGGRAGEEAR